MDVAAGQQAPARVGTFLYGSCVSRDSFEVFDHDRFVLDRYVARQSLISAWSPTSPGLLSAAELASPFQRRMLEGDLGGTLPQQLRRHATTSSLVVVDLTDERLGVLRLPDGSHVTRSHELLASRALERLDAPVEAVPFGSGRHFALWHPAARRFARLLDELALRERTLVLAVPWARVTRRGAAVPASAGMTAATADPLYARYHAYLRDRCGLRLLHVPPEIVLADDDHRWGASPYHYVDEVYAWVRAAVEEAVGVS